MNFNTIFEGLKVIELANILAGPSVGMFFAELGAEVIKIENKATKGDITRSWRLPSESTDNNYSAYYCSVNWKKQVLMLDLKSNDDLQQLYDLVKSADVVITNFKSSSAKKIGIDHSTLQNLNHKLIIGHLTGFPNSDRPAFDIVLQAETGFLYMNGENGRPPVKMPVALIDVLAAHQLKEALLLALLHRERTGKGQIVLVSLYEAAIASLVNQATNWLMAGFIPQRIGTQHPNIAPYGDMFYTKDGKMLVLAVGTERQFEGLCKTLGLEYLLIDERFKTNTERVQNRTELAKILEQEFITYDEDDVVPRLKKAKVPLGNVRNMQEVFEQSAAQKLILEEVFDDGWNTKRVKSFVAKVSDTS
jgi:crotonobetainyl-CoA:carnitine CoA-transferase CaiB-like acyl-CoA transferase